MHKRLIFSVLGLLLAGLVLAISFWRLTFSSLTGTSREESLALAKTPIATRLRDLFTPPYLPDSPLYLTHVFCDRYKLETAPKNKRMYWDIHTANERMQTVKALLAHSRQSLALTTLTKGEKYLLSAAGDRYFASASDYNDASALLQSTISSHIEQMSAMKPQFNDQQRAVIDSLIEQLKVIKLSP